MKTWLRLISALALNAGSHGADWQTTQDPGATPNHIGSAWLRAWVKVDDGFFTKHERNVFEESVGVNIRDLAGAHEVWVDGIRIGTGGVFPPDYQSAGNTLFRHKVAVGTLHRGEWNEVAIRVHHSSGPGGFGGEAPFIMNYFLECGFTGEWEFLAADDYQPGGAVTNRPARTSSRSMETRMATASMTSTRSSSRAAIWPTPRSAVAVAGG